MALDAERLALSPAPAPSHSRGAAAGLPAWVQDDTPSGALVAQIRIEIADAPRYAALAHDVRGLVGRAAECNVFAEPAFVLPAAQLAGASVRVLLAWIAQGRDSVLVGAWPLADARPPNSPLPLRVLAAPLHEYGLLATPVIDATYLDETLGAMLEAIERDAGLPKILAFDQMADDGPVMVALVRALARRGAPMRVLEQHRRPKLASSLDGRAYLQQALSGSSRKKLRQQRRRLGERGVLARAVHAGGDVRAAFEDFLALEAKGWKGRKGTAMLCDRKAAAFVRAAVNGLAAAGLAEIHALTLDAKPVSMQVVLRSGPAAFTWKTTFDEEFGDLSPGMLLIEDCTHAFLDDPRIGFVDSCTHGEASYMSVWQERQGVAQLWIDVRRDGSLLFGLAAATQETYWRVREHAKQGYLAAQKTWRGRRRASSRAAAPDGAGSQDPRRSTDT